MIRIGTGFDAHRFSPGRRLVLGGVVIPHEKGLLGHSDADVLAHAIADALLGAVSAGDIGQHFPDTDPRWKDADSLHLLACVAEIVRGKGGLIGNVDSTIIAQQPKIAPFREAMARNIAKALRIDVACVSIKATTTEHMGAVGREEGILAMAVCTVDSSDGPRSLRESSGT